MKQIVGLLRQGGVCCPRCTGRRRCTTRAQHDKVLVLSAASRSCQTGNDTIFMLAFLGRHTWGLKRVLFLLVPWERTDYLVNLFPLGFPLVPGRRFRFVTVCNPPSRTMVGPVITYTKPRSVPKLRCGDEHCTFSMRAIGILAMYVWLLVRLCLHFSVAPHHPVLFLVGSVITSTKSRSVPNSFCGYEHCTSCVRATAEIMPVCVCFCHVS